MELVHNKERKERYVVFVSPAKRRSFAKRMKWINLLLVWAKHIFSQVEVLVMANNLWHQNLVLLVEEYQKYQEYRTDIIWCVTYLIPYDICDMSVPSTI